MAVSLIKGYCRIVRIAAKPEEGVKANDVTASIFSSDGNGGLFDELDVAEIFERTDNPKVYRAKGYDEHSAPKAIILISVSEKGV